MGSRSGLPPRLQWYVGALELTAGERVLEVGCGTGQAACAMAAVAGPGLVTAIDRSAAATDAGRKNAAKAGHDVRFAESALADFEGGPFDVIAACRVNVFWTGDGAAELQAVRRLLADGGRLCICLQPPAASKLDGEIAAVRTNLTAAGFQVMGERRDDAVPAACLVATVSPGGPGRRTGA